MLSVCRCVMAEACAQACLEGTQPLQLNLRLLCLPCCLQPAPVTCAARRPHPPPLAATK